MRRTPGGFSLIEVMVAAFCLTIIVSALYSIMAASQSAVAAGTTVQSLEEQVRLALREMADELRQTSSGGGSVLVFGSRDGVDNDGDGAVDERGEEPLRFQMCTGWRPGEFEAAFASPHVVYRSLPDGSQRMLVREQADQPTLVLARGVQEGSLRFEDLEADADGYRGVRISLTLERADERGRMIRASGSILVRLRNL